MSEDDKNPKDSLFQGIVEGRFKPIEAHVSDLFFNHSHDEYMGLSEEASEADAYGALLRDAETFAGMVEGAFGVKLDPPSLVMDFLARV